MLHASCLVRHGSRLSLATRSIPYGVLYRCATRVRSSAQNKGPQGPLDEAAIKAAIAAHHQRRALIPAFRCPGCSQLAYRAAKMLDHMGACCPDLVDAPAWSQVRLGAGRAAQAEGLSYGQSAPIHTAHTHRPCATHRSCYRASPLLWLPLPPPRLRGDAPPRRFPRAR